MAVEETSLGSGLRDLEVLCRFAVKSLQVPKVVRHSLILIPRTEPWNQTRHGIAVSWRLIFAVQNGSAKTAKIICLEDFRQYGVNT